MNRHSILKRAAALALCLCLLITLTGCSVESKYDAANRLLSQGKFDKAAEKFEELGSYADSSLLTIYARAAAAGEAGDFDLCFRAFETLGDFKDSAMMIAYYEARQYEARGMAGLALEDPLERWDSGFHFGLTMAAKHYDELPLFRDCQARAERCRKAVYQQGEAYEAAGQYRYAVPVFGYLAEYSDSAMRSQYNAALAYEEMAKYDSLEEAADYRRWEPLMEAAAIYDQLPLYKDSDTRGENCRIAVYELAGQIAGLGLYQEASDAYAALGAYNDSNSLSAYYAACQLEADGQYENAALAFEAMGEYSDAADRAVAARTKGYEAAETKFAEGDYEAAAELFGQLSKAPEGQPDPLAMLHESRYQQGLQLVEAGRYQDAIALLDTMADEGIVPMDEAAEPVPHVLNRAHYLSGIVQMTRPMPDYEAAIAAFEEAGDYTHTDGDVVTTAAARVAECWYLQGEAMLTAVEGREADDHLGLSESSIIRAFHKAGGYPGASIRLQTAYYQLGEKYLAEGQYQRAARCFESVGRINEIYAVVTEGMGEAGDPLFSREQLAADTKAAGLGDWETRALECFWLLGKEQLAEKNYGHAMLAFARAKDYPGADVQEQKLRQMYKGIITAGQMHVLALKPDGTVLAWGEDWDEGGVNVSEWKDMAAVSADLRKSVGLTTDGTLVQTNGLADDEYYAVMLAVGEIEEGDETPEWTDLAVVHALSNDSLPFGQPRAIGVRMDGTFFGPNEFYDSLFTSDDLEDALLKAQNWTDLVDVSAGSDFLMGLRNDGTVVAAGANSEGQCNVQEWTDVIEIAAGPSFAVGLKADGTVLFTGHDQEGKLDVSGWTDIVAIAADRHIIGLKADGRVVATGSGTRVLDVDEWSNIVAIDVNSGRTIGLTADGKLITTKASYEDNPFDDWSGIFPNPDRVKTPEQKREDAYRQAEALLSGDAPDYDAAAEAFAAMGDYAPMAADGQGKELPASQRALECMYLKGESLLNGETPDYDAAAEAFAALGDYAPAASAGNGNDGDTAADQPAPLPASQRALECMYLKGESLLSGEAPDYDTAAEVFAALGDYAPAASAGNADDGDTAAGQPAPLPASQRALECMYLKGESLLSGEEPDLTAAQIAFAEAGEFAPLLPDGQPGQPAWLRVQECYYLRGVALLSQEEPDYDRAQKCFMNAEDYVTADGKSSFQVFFEMCYANGEDKQALQDYAAAAEAFEAAGGYEPVHYDNPGAPAEDRAKECRYLYGEALLAGEDPDYAAALEAFTAAGNHTPEGGSAPGVRYQELCYGIGERLLAAGEYEAAAEAFKQAGDYAPPAQEGGEAPLPASTRQKESYYRMAETGFDALIPDYLLIRRQFATAGDFVPAGGVSGEERYQQLCYEKGRQLEETGYSGYALKAYRQAGDNPGAAEAAAVLVQTFRRHIAAGNAHTVGLRVDGTVVATGDNTHGQLDVAGWTDVTAVAAGSYFTLGLKADGTVLAAGDNEVGQLDVEDWTEITALAAGSGHTVGLKADGTVVAAGINNGGQLNVRKWTEVVAIAAGTVHTVGLRADGTVVAVGSNDFGQLNVDEWTDVVAITAGGTWTIGLKADGSLLLAGGENVLLSYGLESVSGWTELADVSVCYANAIGMKRDGTLVGAGRNQQHELDFTGWTDIVAVEAGDRFTVGVKADGSVVAIGQNNFGQLNVQDWQLLDAPEASVENIPAADDGDLGSTVLRLLNSLTGQ